MKDGCIMRCGIINHINCQFRDCKALLVISSTTETLLVVWHSGNALVSINKVAQRSARLAAGWERSFKQM